MKHLRVLVVDDSAFNRQTLSAMLEAMPAVEVVGRASNGTDALAQTFAHKPDLITLDLEMPEMDGFAFLRLVMAKQPTPVIVISSHAKREHVFRALELGALDFVAKPERTSETPFVAIERELRRKVEMMGRLRTLAPRPHATPISSAPHVATAAADVPPSSSLAPLLGLVCVGASTGGPPAIQTLLAGLSHALPVAILIAQHMPPRFTTTFAERLDRLLPWVVREAEDCDLVEQGTVYIAPGGRNLTVRTVAGRTEAPWQLVTHAAEGVVPCADALFASAGELGPRLCAVVLTGMGQDGSRGCVTAHAQGATVMAEDPKTATMPGMPFATVKTGICDHVAPLAQLCSRIATFANGLRRAA